MNFKSQDCKNCGGIRCCKNDLELKIIEQSKELINLINTKKSIENEKEDKNNNIEISIKKIGNISQKEYNSKYYSKNKDKYKIKNICADCKGTYTLATKSYHFKSKMHNKIINALKK